MRTKADIVLAVATKAGVSGKTAKVAVQTVLDSIIKYSERDGGVMLKGFGTFRYKTRQGRTYKTSMLKAGEVTTAGRRVMHLKPSKSTVVPA